MVEKKTTQPKKTDEKKTEKIVFKGKYIETVGRRKSSVARIRLYQKGSGQIIVNGESYDKYFDTFKTLAIITAIIKQAGADNLDFSIVVNGGGRVGQADACRHGIARSLIELDETLRPALKAKGWLTRDARVKERKKPGLKKARRAPQWSKR